MQTIYGLISDNGDGSSSMHWFREYSIIDVLVDKDVERWGSNDGGPAERLTFPDNLNLEECGFSFSDSEYDHLITEEVNEEFSEDEDIYNDGEW